MTLRLKKKLFPDGHLPKRIKQLHYQEQGPAEREKLATKRDREYLHLEKQVHNEELCYHGYLKND